MYVCMYVCMYAWKTMHRFLDELIVAELPLWFRATPAYSHLSTGFVAHHSLRCYIHGSQATQSPSVSPSFVSYHRSPPVQLTHLYGRVLRHAAHFTVRRAVDERKKRSIVGRILHDVSWQVHRADLPGEELKLHGRYFTSIYSIASTRKLSS